MVWVVPRRQRVTFLPADTPGVSQVVLRLDEDGVISRAPDSQVVKEGAEIRVPSGLSPLHELLQTVPAAELKKFAKEKKCMISDTKKHIITAILLFGDGSVQQEACTVLAEKTGGSRVAINVQWI